jgi:cytoskeletal protein CcmA (bactofilin family)
MNDDNLNGKRTVVEEGTSFKGTLSSSCPIDVRGRIEGEVETPSLVVSASGAVHGRAKVGSVRSDGELSGEFEADSFELAGTVRDNTKIRARSLEVKPSPSNGKMTATLGDCELSIGDEPTEFDIVEEPVAAQPVLQVAAELEAPAPAAEAASAEAPELREAFPSAMAIADEPSDIASAVVASASPPLPPEPVEAQLEVVDDTDALLAAAAEAPQAEAAALAPIAPSSPTAEDASSYALEDSDLSAAPAPLVPGSSPDTALDAVLEELGFSAPAPLSSSTHAKPSSPEPDVESESDKASRKRRREDEREHSGWSQPPSQPPPAG